MKWSEFSAYGLFLFVFLGGKCKFGGNNFAAVFAYRDSKEDYGEYNMDRMGDLARFFRVYFCAFIYLPPF